LQKAKTYLRGQFPLRVESPDALAGRLAEIMFHGLPEDDLFTYRTRVAAVTGDDVAKVTAATMPDPSAVAIVIVGKAAEIRPQLEAQFGPVETIPASDCENLSLRKD